VQIVQFLVNIKDMILKVLRKLRNKDKHIIMQF
jgi:hypothetical protein